MKVLFGCTIFSSAFLLFSIQPMIAKTILPWFGGAASVWITALLFFQVVLLLGYLYAYGISRLPGRAQAAVHIALLALAAATLPLAPSAALKPTGGEDPIPRILWLLLTAVGAPYFLLSATGPLVQSWYARRFQNAPYRLYALSNAGSLLALLCYPVAIEPLLTIRRQLWIWSALFAAYAAMCGVSAWRSRAAEWKEAGVADDSPAPAWKTSTLWLLFAAFPSALLLAVTTHLCQNVASIPFLWILPLTLYLLTFILVFDRPDWYRPALGDWILFAGLGLTTLGLTRMQGDSPLWLLIPTFCVGFFLICLFCHGELVVRRPSGRHATAFYLTVASGGALGSLCVGLGASYLLSGNFELPIVVAACGIFVLFNRYGKHWIGDVVWTAAAVGLIVSAGVQIRSARSNVKVMSRNFYGALRVVDSPPGTRPEEARRSLVHGVISHGVQFLSPGRRLWPTAYYGPDSGAGRALTAIRRPALRAGVVGLGAGTLAVYGEPGELYRFYEIDPEVVKLAREEFTFLRDCRARVEVLTGDGRLLLEREPPNGFDVLVVDAFSGDSIPLHLLTAEAFRLYSRHLRPDGILTIHISNTYLDLEPVLRRLAAETGWKSRAVVTAGNAAKGVSVSLWMVMAARDESFTLLNIPAEPAWRASRRASLWTDDFSNPFRLLK